MIPHQQLKHWFCTQRRDLPWRRNPTPYAVWISEVMLQQTQVAVVVPYFERWMQRFPTIKALAKAPLDDVIKMWEGLGYYSRARHLHAGAQHLINDFKGKLPEDQENLKKIKGLGPYTIGAILSFAFKKKCAAVDGNVMRVLARFFKVEEDVSKPKTQNAIRQLAENSLPDEEPWIFNEALIELGATICNRRPKCFECPLAAQCAAHREGLEESLPYKSKKTAIQKLHRIVCVIRHRGLFLVKKGAKGKIMSDLYEFPYFEIAENNLSLDRLVQDVNEQWNLQTKIEHTLPVTKHSFTRYQVQLTPFLFSAKTVRQVDSFEWIPLEELKQKAFSSGHRRILHSLNGHL